MPLRRPYDCVRVMVDDDRDVLVAFLIAGLVNADIHKPVQSAGAFRLNHVQSAVDASAGRFPIDAHVLGDGASREICRKPPGREVKVFRKSAAGISPWDIGNIYPVFRAVDAVCPVFHLHEDAARIHPPPCTGDGRMFILYRAGLMAKRAVILMPFIWSCLDADMLHTISIRVKVAVFDNSVLDIQDIFA